MALEPITRREQIIAGKDLEPITRMEKFLKQYGGGSGGASNAVPHVTIKVQATSGTNVAFDSAVANMTYDEVVNGVLNGRITHLTYSVMFDNQPIEVGTSTIAGFYGLIQSGSPLVFLITDAAASLGFIAFQWQVDNTIGALSE